MPTTLGSSNRNRKEMKHVRHHASAQPWTERLLCGLLVTNSLFCLLVQNLALLFPHQMEPRNSTLQETARITSLFLTPEWGATGA